MRAVRVPFSPARPSRLKNEPGIFPAAYIRSSTSTVRGRKSTSRRFPAVAVHRTMVSPERTTTAPEACLASLPVSNEISVPWISTDTRVTASDIFNSLPLRPSVGGVLLDSSLSPNAVMVAGWGPPRRSADDRVERDGGEQQREVEQREVEGHRGPPGGVGAPQAPGQEAQSAPEAARRDRVERPEHPGQT